MPEASAAQRRGRDPVRDLRGAVNDAVAFSDVLRSTYGFDSTNVVLLLDQEATRAVILTALERFVDLSRPNDRLVFYFAGHGAERRNSRTRKVNGRDQTLVPADVNRGVPDVRGPEVARIVARAARRGATILLIFDSCFSGGLARGIQPRIRWANFDSSDVADSLPVPNLTQLGVITLSAARDDQVAGEGSDHTGATHGYFTSALLQVLRSTSPAAPVSTVFERTRSTLAGSLRIQQPVVDASPERLRLTLFGETIREGDRSRLFAVAARLSNNRFRLAAGFAQGIRPGTELELPADTTVVLTVDSVLSLGSSTVRSVTTNGRLEPGTLLRIRRLGVSPSALRVWVPKGVSAAAFGIARQDLVSLRRQLGSRLAADPIEAVGTAAVLLPGSGAWRLIAGETAESVTGSLATGLLATKWFLEAPPTTRLAVVLPPTAFMTRSLETGLAAARSVVQLVDDVHAADYLLAGRLGVGDKAEYAWIRPGRSETDDLDPLPARTDWVQDPQALVTAAELLARCKAWMELPVDVTPAAFPYRLRIENEAGTAVELSAGVVRGGQSLRMRLQFDSTAFEHADQLERRHVYVFVIDQRGEATLVYPADGDPLNRFPYGIRPESPWPASIRLPGTIDVTEPFGLDTYFLLTSKEPLPLDALQWGAEASPLTVRGSDGNLATLIRSIGGFRGAQARPSGWSVERIRVFSTPP
jgi:hypothetical protein